MILKSWDDVKTEEPVYFGVCCSASNVSSHSLWESTPTMHCMDHHVSYSLWADGEEISLYILVLIYFDFPDVDVFLLLYVKLVVMKLGMHFISKKPLCKLQTKGTLHFCCWGLSSCKYGILVCKQMNCLYGWFIFNEGTKMGVESAVHSVYMISTLFWYLQLRSGCIHITS